MLDLHALVPGVSKMQGRWGVTFGGMSQTDLRAHLTALGLEPPPRDWPHIRAAVVAVLQGQCWLQPGDDDQQVPLHAGDVAVLFGETPHTLRDQPDTPAVPLRQVIRREHLEHHRGLRLRGAGPLTVLLHGAVAFDDPEASRALLALPRLLHTPGINAQPAPHLRGVVHTLVQEVARYQPGTHCLVDHLVQVLLELVIRDALLSIPRTPSAQGLAAIIDPQIGPILTLLHQHPQRAWTVAAMADHVLMSRSAFAMRFTAFTGRSPFQYLTERRIHLARSLLTNPNLGLKHIAARVGYANAFSFSTAFKRITGLSPSQYRHHHHRAPSASAPDSAGD
jgi:AraC-like DNA-binding protein